jgi:hypothetical protein
VVKLPRESLPPAERGNAVTLGPTTLAVVRDVESWLEPERLRACRIPVGSALPPSCSAATPRMDGALDPERFLFVTRSYPEIHRLDLPPPYVAAYELPLQPGAGESRDFAFTEPGLAECTWYFTRVEGVRVEGALPARRVRLRSDDGRPALLVIEKPFGTHACHPLDLDRRYPPCLLETPPEDPIQARARSF